jgi:3-hydroxyacyl-CoA dehydrogenase
MFHADTQGLRSVVDGMAALAATLGNDYGYWTPAPLLSRLAAADRTFADWTRS